VSVGAGEQGQASAHRAGRPWPPTIGNIASLLIA